MANLQATWNAPLPVDLAATNFLFLVLGTWGAFMPNPLETIWSVFMLWLVLRLFWWQNFPPILVYGIIMPWIEVHFSLYEANFYGQTLDELFLDTGRQTYWMASVGLLFIMLGMRWVLKRNWSRLTPVSKPCKPQLNNWTNSEFSLPLSVFDFYRGYSIRSFHMAAA